MILMILMLICDVLRYTVDVACSAGESTRHSAVRLPEQLASIDLSPNFLAVAELRHRYWHPPITVVLHC